MCANRGEIATGNASPRRSCAAASGKTGTLAESAATILTIEDEPIVRQSMASYLEDRWFTVLQAENGRIGLDQFRREKPDLILVDLRMPEVDGLEVLATVTRESANTPILVVSGTGAIADAVEALHLGAWDYLLKPIEDLEILLHAVDRALERARLLDSNRRYQEHLEEQVEQRTAELRSTNQVLSKEIEDRKRAEAERERLIRRLEAQNAELERFTYTVSHDLKAPLITVKGFIGVVREDVSDGDTQAILDNLARMDRAADKMANLLEDLLDLSRVGRLINPSEDVPLEGLAREALEMAQHQIDQLGIQVDVSTALPVVHGDRQRLFEVLQNLIDNAVKYIGDQPQPRIEIGARRQGEETICYVRDNGIGIDPRYHEKVFGLFEQLDQTTQGSGVGLALVKRIIEIHGGRIWVESEGIGHGATFCFTIPPNQA